MINGDVAESAPIRSAGDRTKPVGRNGIKVAPTSDVLGGQSQVVGHQGRSEPFDYGDEEHGRDATRNVLAVNMIYGDECGTPSKMSDPASRLRTRRLVCGLTVEGLAVQVGMAPSTVRAHENGQNGIRQPAARKYARALSTTPEWLMFGTGPQEGAVNDSLPAARSVPILGVIQAGAFVEIPDDPEPQEFVPFYDPRYARASVFALRVIGRSMDMHYPEGTVVYAVPAVEIGVREGDHVVVRREKAGLFETTLKEILLDGGKLALRPRSTDPAHQSIVRVSEGDWPEIIGVVIGSYVPATPRSAHVLMPGGL